MRDTSMDEVAGRLDGPAPRKDANRAWVKGGRKNAWYLPTTNVYPLEQSLFETDLRRVIREYVLPGHVPAAPMLDETKAVVTIGSCFAGELRRFLMAAGVDASRFLVPPGLNNTFAILDFLSWCATGEQTGAGFRYERVAGGEIREWTPDSKRKSYAEFFSGIGAFVFTIGLAEVWQDRETGGVFWRGIPDEIFDANRHVFRLTTVDENARNLTRMIEIIRTLNPTAPIVLTLSPVPLMATFRDISCLTADCVSKSVLRVALDQVMSTKPANVYYWPSFEIVKWVGANLPWASYGRKGEARAIDRPLVQLIMDEFVEAFYTPEARAGIRARAATVPDDSAEDGED
ncbi:MAG: GSCFA domain-containing protein [Vicinamibacterales bacterium]|nr:GSCFA domain-containing protein [Vicinamibacterales bacterium]